MADETIEEISTSASVVVSEIAGIDFAREVRRAFPGLRLIQAIRLSLQLPGIVLAVVGVYLSQAAWRALDAGLLDSDSSGGGFGGRLISPIAEIDSSWLPGNLERLIEPIQVLAGPLLSFVSTYPLSRTGLHAGLAGLATIVIWGLIGGALARMTLVRMGWDRGPSASRALSYAARKARPLIATPLLPVLVLLFTALLCAGFGLVFRVPWIGESVGGLLLIIPIGLGLLMFIMVVGLAAGWPLMVASVMAEGEDELDALSRSFSYINHRLGRYFLYLLLAFLIGIPGLWLVEMVASGTLSMTHWGLGLTAPRESLAAFFDPDALRPDLMVVAEDSPSSSGTGALSAFWIGFVRLIPRAWAYSYFWSSIAIIYLLIRKDVDGAEWAQLTAESIDGES